MTAEARHPRDRGLRVAALYDVHAMPHALEAVLAEVEGAAVDAIVFGGDVICGPLPLETLELVRSVDAQFVRGNCERDPGEWLVPKVAPPAIEAARARAAPPAARRGPSCP